MAAAADLLDPLCQPMRQWLMLARVLHGDDTSVKLRLAGAAKAHQAHRWVCIGDADHP
jgi:hypothetical protein